MVMTKLPDGIILTIELVSSVAIVLAMGMILTLIGVNIYASFVVAH